MDEVIINLLMISEEPLTLDQICEAVYNILHVGGNMRGAVLNFLREATDFIEEDNGKFSIIDDDCQCQE